MLQSQVKKLESSLASAREEADKTQGKCSVQVRAQILPNWLINYLIRISVSSQGIGGI